MNIRPIKTIVAAVAFTFATGSISAQYMKVGSDSISLAEFKKDYKYGLENAGIESTIATTQNFYLFQQFAAEQKADTTRAFRQRMAEKESELRAKYFFPAHVVDPILSNYVKDNQTEREVQVFIVEKTAGDKQDYRQVYNDVKAGKITMAEAISKYTKGNPEALYIKAGTLDNRLYDEVKVLANNTYTQLYDTPSYVGFAKLISTRPSLGYLVFGTLSFPNDANAEETRQKIYADLKSGKSFQEVAKLYGANDHEKNNGGVIMGSPTLPDEVYAALKGQKAGYYTPAPLTFGEKQFIFNLYSVEPYALTETNKPFFLREMNSSLYAEVLQEKMTDFLKSDPTYKEFPAFANSKKSYASFAAAKDSDVLYSYKGLQVTVGALRKMIGDKRSEAEKMTPSAWAEALASVNAQDVLRIYSQNFTSQPQVKTELDMFKRGLYSDFIYSAYLNEQVAQHPEWLTQYYNQNKSKFVWGERADGRVAILEDPKLAKEISKEIKNAGNWEALQKKYAAKLNDRKQPLVKFEKGEMNKDADVFTKYKVPFRTGVHQTKMGDRTLVIAIDRLLAPSQMTQTEAAEEIRDAVNEQKLNEIIAAQKAKTKIVIDPAFISGLQQNFKK